MKVLHFYNGSDFFTQEVPWFEWDNAAGKYLKEVAGTAYGLLTSFEDEQINAVYDTLKEVRLHKLNYKYDKTNQAIPELVNKGYEVYSNTLDKMLTKLAAVKYWLASKSATEDEKEKDYYSRKILDYVLEVQKELYTLKSGKINMTMRDGKTRAFDYIYTTSNALDYRGMLFYAPETREIKDFKGEVERKIFKR